LTPQSGAPQPPADFDRIVPRRPAGTVDGATAQRADPHAAARISATAFWITAIGLALLAVLVFAVLPRWVERDARPPTAAAPSPAAPVATPAPAAPAPPTVEPSKAAWDDPALLEARAAAQAARSQYQDQSAQLESHGVSRWGSGELGRANARASAGEKAFGARDFATARTDYEAAATTTAALLAEVPQRLAATLDAGTHALEAGDKAAAQQAFELAQAIEPTHAGATRGLRRVASLDVVRAQLDAARRLEQAGDIAGARAAWKQALALDPDTRSARDALARADADARDAEFRRVLGEAFDALDRGQYDLADKRLAQARKLNAGDPGVQQAGARLAEARRGQALANLQREAAAQVAAEDWTNAVSTYRKALQIDPSVAYARDGLAQAEPRAALAQRLQDFIDRPVRLSTPTIAADAEKALADARAISAPGPRLGAQRAALERALAAAAKPVSVQLRSDGKTEVSVYRIGPLGKFTSHALELKPGRYVAVGTRDGYRDVRHDFEVAAGAQDVSVEIRCEERL
jgi:Tfp pilus assembly protein PilF